MNSLATKGLIGFLLVIVLWNVTKLPFLMSFNNDGDVEYNSHGIELSINLGHWVKGYRSKKMRTPACNFMLVHAALGITCVCMMILSLIKKSWRKKYCVPFFIFAIVEGLHAFPASILNDSPFLVKLFICACILLVGSGVWGLQTIFNYDTNPQKAEKNLFIQYSIVTVVNSAAAFLETPNIIAALKAHEEDGVWTTYGETPHSKFGHTVYDKLPEKVGMTIFLGFCFVFWFIWPLYLTQIKGDDDDKKEEKGVGENEPLIVA
jgi:FtsH-binding integral membrane protein